MNPLNLYGRFFDINVEELLVLLRELVAEKNNLTYKDRLLGDEIDYADSRIEIHISMGVSPKGSEKHRYILSGTFRATMNEAVLLFTEWRNHFKDKKIKCDFEITEEDENGKEINMKEIKD